MAQFSDRLDILAGGAELPIAAFFVKWKIQKENLCHIEPKYLAGGVRFGLSKTPDQKVEEKRPMFSRNAIRVVVPLALLILPGTVGLRLARSQVGAKPEAAEAAARQAIAVDPSDCEQGPGRRMRARRWRTGRIGA